MEKDKNWIFRASIIFGVFFGHFLAVPMDRVDPGALAKMMILYGASLSLVLLFLSLAANGISDGLRAQRAQLRMKLETTSLALLFGIFLGTL